MDIRQAREIIETLADGINPITGEIFSKNDIFNQPDIIRALYTAKEQLKKAENLKKRKLPENTGKPWSAEDDQKLREMYLQGVRGADLCEYFKRTPGAITARLERLGLIFPGRGVDGHS
ncbi:MAG: hypothetical protein IJL87_02470 [Clostridia bacterium]|nr:hypothetical protein [Clostridia bacterium]